MALTPEDVVNKRFQPTKFREGYDQDEVDDFLDEVVVELRRLNQENEELRQRLTAAEARADCRVPPKSAPAAPAPDAAYPAPLWPRLPRRRCPRRRSVDRHGQHGPVEHDQPPAARAAAPRGARARGHGSSDALIAEGHATAARVVAEAESGQRQQLGSLDQGALRARAARRGAPPFEREYRQKLKSYIEGQLKRARLRQRSPRVPHLRPAVPNQDSASPAGYLRMPGEPRPPPSRALAGLSGSRRSRKDSAPHPQ